MNATIQQKTELSMAQARTGLADELRRQPAYSALIEAHRLLHEDQAAVELLQAIRARQNQLRFAWTDEDEAKLHQLIEQFNQMPSVQAYGRAEQNLRELFCVVDAVISQVVGVEFAANAKRSCCGG